MEYLIINTAILVWITTVALLLAVVTVKTLYRGLVILSVQLTLWGIFNSTFKSYRFYDRRMVYKVCTNLLVDRGYTLDRTTLAAVYDLVYGDSRFAKEFIRRFVL